MPSLCYTHKLQRFSTPLPESKLWLCPNDSLWAMLKKARLPAYWYSRHNGTCHQIQGTLWQLPDWFKSPTRTFDDNCTSVMKMDQKKWYPPARKAEYNSTFSTSNWMSLPAEEKCRHTVSNCNACSAEHSAVQDAFRRGPSIRSNKIIPNYR